MRWIQETEMVFKISKRSKEDKVTYASAMIKSEALSWWEIVSNLRGDEAIAMMTWEEFKVTQSCISKLPSTKTEYDAGQGGIRNGKGEEETIESVKAKGKSIPYDNNRG
ncbi:hypothetical protein OSB04_un001848 [Centaurea solstitialis]|uniref:Retrotransposon gag domain-containing protein n=1 Tax=Centaurea solstitialis TaxID=347529 RepID=A0AA38SL53_9ASTR|nr:hypothetical protein OSB04_un001848 [Centaurea solstitialis]